MQSSCGIYKNSIIPFDVGNSLRLPGYILRIKAARSVKDIHIYLSGKSFELKHSCGSVNISRDKIRGSAFRFKIHCKFCGGRCFSGTLQTNKHDCRRRFSPELKTARISAQNLYKFISDNLYKLLSRRKALQHILADSLISYPFYKVFDNRKIDVGLQKRHPDIL